MKHILPNSLNLMLTLYLEDQFSHAYDIAERILTADQPAGLAMYVKALCLHRFGQHNLSANLMLELENKEAALNAYDFRYPLLLQQGNSGWLQRYHSRLEQFYRCYHTDGFVISYPKSGRTWLRLMIGIYLLKEVRAEAIEIYELTSNNPDWPTVDVSHDDYPMWKPVDSIVADKTAYQDNRVLLLVRDPRDVIVSFYFQYTKRGDKKLANDSTFNGSMADFIRHDIGGLPSIVRFMNIWAQQRHVPDSFQICRYESLRNKPADELTKVLEFLGWINPDPEHVKNAVKQCEFSRMKKMEKKNKFKNTRLSPPKDGDPEGYKVRKGVVGGYREYLSDEDIRWVNDYMNAHLDDYFAYYKNLT